MQKGRVKNETVDIVISGYGSATEETVVGYRFDPLGNVQKLWHAEIEQASYVSRWEDALFTVTEVDDYCVVYLLKRNNESYSLVDQKKLEGGALCHISYSPKHQVLYGACYTTGTIFGVRVDGDRYGEVIYHEVQHSLSDSALTRAHCVLLHAREDKLLTVNIALDEIICYELKEGIPVFTKRIVMPEGVGPRHATFSEDERLLYIITEYSNEILVYQYEENKLIQRISTLSAGYVGTSNCSTLCITRSGTYLYAANRGADTITQFLIDASGELKWVKDYSCGGQHPRHMILTDQDELLMVCNQFSNNVTAYTIDEITGELIEKVIDLKFNKPSGIVQI